MTIINMSIQSSIVRLRRRGLLRGSRGPAPQTAGWEERLPPPPIEIVGSLRLVPQLAAGLEAAGLMPHFIPLPLAEPEPEDPVLPRPLPQLTVFVRRNAPPEPPPDSASPIRCHQLRLPHFATVIPPILSFSIPKLMHGMDKKETEREDSRSGQALFVGV